MIVRSAAALGLAALFATAALAQPAPPQSAAAIAAAEAAAKKPTPRTADGKVDLSGTWTTSVPGGPGFPVIRGEDGSINVVGPPVGSALAAERFKGYGKRPMPTWGPSYKAELKAKVQETYDKQDHLDPVFYCKMPGVPRLGYPHKIIQLPTETVLLYADMNGQAFRVVPTDGRGYRKDIEPSNNGDSVGRWDGDVFVVETVNFSPETWLGEGWIHSDKMTVTERFTRQGDALTYEVVVNDPESFNEPWKMRPVKAMITAIPLDEPFPCMDVDGPLLENDDHH